MKNSVNKLKKVYNENKLKKVGDECTCPSCCSIFIKQYYQQVFCKTNSGTVCKDNYWNNVTPTKRNNVQRISPANARYYSNVIEPFKESYHPDYDDDQSWDAHKLD